MPANLCNFEGDSPLRYARKLHRPNITSRIISHLIAKKETLETEDLVSVIIEDDDDSALETLTYYLAQPGVNANKLCVMDGEAVSALSSLHAEYNIKAQIKNDVVDMGSKGFLMLMHKSILLVQKHKKRIGALAHIAARFRKVGVYNTTNDYHP